MSIIPQPGEDLFVPACVKKGIYFVGWAGGNKKRHLIRSLIRSTTSNSKLQIFGVQGKAFGWIESFLAKRSQTEVLNGNSSDELQVISGVPQGSLLGPFPFLLYINDLPDSLQSQVRLVADDTALYLTVQSQTDSKKFQNCRNGNGGWVWSSIRLSVRLCTSPGPDDL